MALRMQTFFKIPRNSVDVTRLPVYNNRKCTPCNCRVFAGRKCWGVMGEKMRKRRILAAFFGMLAAAGAAATLMLALTARDRETVVLKEDPRVMACAQSFLDELCAMDLEGASAELLGEPKLTMVPPETDVEKILWDRYWTGLEGKLEGQPYAQGSFLTVNARITYPDVGAVIQRMGVLAQEQLWQRVEQAQSVFEVYDETGSYRQDVLDQVLLQALWAASEQTTAVCEKSIALRLAYDGEDWKIVPGRELRDLLSGAMDGG